MIDHDRYVIFPQDQFHRGTNMQRDMDLTGKQLTIETAKFAIARLFHFH